MHRYQLIDYCRAVNWFLPRGERQVSRFARVSFTTSFCHVIISDSLLGIHPPVEEEPHGRIGNRGGFGLERGQERPQDRKEHEQPETPGEGGPHDLLAGCDGAGHGAFAQRGLKLSPRVGHVDDRRALCDGL